MDAGRAVPSDENCNLEVVMSTPYAPVPGRERGELDSSYYEDEAGYGLVTFAASCC